jgi:hypothetical protein
LSLLEKHPLGREILPEHESFTSQLYIPKVNLTLAKEGPELLVNDTELSETLYGNDHDFTGEARLDSETFDAKGISVPTEIFNSAEEAIDLDSFPAEVRGFVKNVFLEKYPHVVSLHALDAGDLSKTLGFTHLRLRSGEILPRSKRLFQISPSDTRHLADICEALCQLEYIRKAPWTRQAAIYMAWQPIWSRGPSQAHWAGWSWIFHLSIHF